MVIARMPYALIVLDAENRLVDFNLAARALPNLGELALHQTAWRALGAWWDKISPLIGSEPVSKDVPVRSGSTELIFRVMSLPLLQASGWRIGQVFLFEDVTQARLAQRQQAQALWAQATLEERSQLANELHDGISQSLAFLNLQSQAAQIYLQTGQSQAALDSLLRLSEAAGEIQAETRELIGSLLSVSLPAENFCKSLRQIVADFEQQTGLAVHLEIEIDPAMGMDMTLETLCDPARLSPLIAVQLIRITQEALANVRKHAQGASQVSMQLNAWDGQLWLTISDDGAGFDPADPKNRWQALRPAGDAAARRPPWGSGYHPFSARKGDADRSASPARSFPFGESHKRMRILLADDHGLFVEGLQNLLQAGGYAVVGAAYDGLEALKLARALHPDLILMDIRMPNCDGLKATRLIKTELPEIQIVMLTTSAEDADLFEALKSGACGYLLKNLKPNELFDYLTGLERGEAPLSPELSARLLREFARQAAELDEHKADALDLQESSASGGKPRS